MGGNFDVFDGVQLDSQNLTHQNSKSIAVFTDAWSKTLTIHQKFSIKHLKRDSAYQNFPHQKLTQYSSLILYSLLFKSCSIVNFSPKQI